MTFGGFAELTICTPDDVFKAMKESNTLTDEFTACQQELLSHINRGKIKLRLKGAKKDSFTMKLADERRKVVQIIQSTGQRAWEEFKAITMDRWSKRFPNQDPVKCGMAVKKVNVHGTPTMCVLIRKLPEGEFDLEIE